MIETVKEVKAFFERFDNAICEGNLEEVLYCMKAAEEIDIEFLPNWVEEELISLSERATNTFWKVK